MTLGEIISGCGKVRDGLVFIYMLSLADDKGMVPVSMYQIADELDMQRSSLSKIMNRLEALNLIKRTRERSHERTHHYQKLDVTICNIEKYANLKTYTQAYACTFTPESEKENPLIPPKSTPYNPLKIYPPIIPQEKDALTIAREKFENWLRQHCPYIASHYKLLSEAELDKLKQAYGTQMIMDVCEDLENRLDKRKLYINLYRTLLNWLKRAKNGNSKQTYSNNSRTAEERAAGAASIVARLIAENKPVA